MSKIIKTVQWNIGGGKVRNPGDDPEDLLAHCHDGLDIIIVKPTVRIFALGYIGNLENGEIKLSPRHTGMKWIDPADFKPEDYFTGGWLEGAREYMATRKK